MDIFPSMSRRYASVSLPFLLGTLAGCARVSSAAAPALVMVAGDAAKAAAAIATTGASADDSSLWGIAKGMGLEALKAAEIVGPLVVPGLAPALAVVQGIIDLAAPLEATAATSATAAVQLGIQAKALIAAAAPLVSVASNVKAT